MIPLQPLPHTHLQNIERVNYTNPVRKINQLGMYMFIKSLTYTKNFDHTHSVKAPIWCNLRIKISPMHLLKRKYLVI